MTKAKSNGKVKIITVLLCLVTLVVGFVLGGLGYLYINQEKSDTLVIGEFEVHFLELGNKYTGDAIYIRAGTTDILIDAGSRTSSASTIISYIDQYVTDGVLEFVIATHADQDHISAFYSTSSYEGIFEHYQVETIIDFPNTNKTTVTYNNYVAARDNEVAEGAVHYTALECYNEENGASRIYQISSNVQMEILYNYYYDHYSSNENNYSVCVIFHQGDNHYLFTGDLEESGEKYLVNYNELPECVLFKAGHHGSGTSSTETLLEIIKPQYIVITTCAGTSEYTDNNDNQFPYQAVIDRIAKYTDKVYITSVVDNYVDKSSWSSNGTVKSMNGNIIFTVTHGYVTVTGSNNNLVLKDTEWFKENRTCPAEWA